MTYTPTTQRWFVVGTHQMALDFARSHGLSVRQVISTHAVRMGGLRGYDCPVHLIVSDHPATRDDYQALDDFAHYEAMRQARHPEVEAHVWRDGAACKCGEPFPAAGRVALPSWMVHQFHQVSQAMPPLIVTVTPAGLGRWQSNVAEAALEVERVRVIAEADGLGLIVTLGDGWTSYTPSDQVPAGQLLRVEADPFPPTPDGS